MSLPPHVEMLRSELQRRKDKNRLFSLRAFAKLMGQHPSAMSRILNSKQELSIAASAKIMKKLGLTPDQQEIFIVSVANQRYRLALTALTEKSGVRSLKHALKSAEEPSQALAKATLRLKSVTSLVPQLFWQSERDGSTAWYSQRWLDYTGQTLETSVGWGWVVTIHPDDRKESSRRYLEAVANVATFEEEHRILSASGEYRWFSVRTAPSLGEDGRVSSMFSSATDIHDLKLAAGGEA